MRTCPRAWLGMTCLIAILTFFSTSTALAGYTWQSLGPWGGKGLCLAISSSSPTIIYLGTNSLYAYGSTNGGGSWSLLGAYPVLAPGTLALAVAPGNPNLAFAASGEAVFKTINGGSSWFRSDIGIEASTSIASLHFSPTDIMTTYALTQSGNVYKTANGGASWTQAMTGASPGAAEVLAVSPSSPATLYMGTPGAVMKSIDGADTWGAASTGLSFTKATALAVHPTNAQTVYLATSDAGILKTTTGDSPYTPVNTGLTDTDVPLLAICKSAPDTLYAVTSTNLLFKTTDGGTIWTQVGPNPLPWTVNGLQVSPNTADTLYMAVSEEALVRSTDGGATWTAQNKGVAAFSVDSLDADHAGQGVIHAIIQDDLYRTGDGGTNWTRIMDDTDYAAVLGMAVDPANPQIIYAGCNGDIYKSINGGEVWTSIRNGSSLGEIPVVVVDWSNPDKLFILDNGSLVKTNTGAGGSWVHISTLSPQAFQMVQHPTDSNILHVTGSSGVRRSTDGGLTWNPADGFAGSGISRVAHDPLKPSTMYATGDNGVYKSVNSGANWSLASDGLGGDAMHGLAVDSSRPGRLWASNVYNQVLYQSDDSGQSWQPVTLPGNMLIYSNLAHADQRLFMSTYNGLWAAVTGGPAGAGPMGALLLGD